MPQGTQTTVRPEGTNLGAVDLGSNSFHMIVARVVDGQAVVVERMKEAIQLGGALDAGRVLDEAAQQRALDCLKRFGQRARSLPEENVRAVGTNTLRVARNADRFLERAREALGHRIEVISGIEEARLIYSGVTRDRTSQDERQLVIDIGGGSTELIIGEQFRPLDLESLYMGSIAMMKLHFEDGKINAKRMRRAEVAALQELERVQWRFRRLGWNVAIGASGTIRAVERVARENGWGNGTITRESLRKIWQGVLDAGNVERLAALKGLNRSRSATFPGGVAILTAIMESLDVNAMEVSNNALREGLLNDLLGRVSSHDVRSVTVDNFMDRYRVDKAHAYGVERTLLGLLQQVTEAWSLPPVRSRELCSWAARLHEIGLDIAHSQYHKHGAYLIAHGDMPGFSRQEQQLLSALVRAHRRKFPSELWKNLSGNERMVEHLAVLLRLAAVLHRSRSESPQVTVVGGRRSLEVRFAPGWLEAHPLTRADLSEEAALLRAGGFELKLPEAALEP